MDFYSEKYIDLLLKKCLTLKPNCNLFICYDPIFEKIAKRICNKAFENGVRSVSFMREDIFDISDNLKKLEDNFYFEKWNEYANENTAFLIITTEHLEPKTTNEIDKINEIKRIFKERRGVFYEKLENDELSYCITILPNEAWACKLFPNDKDAYLKLQKLIYKMFMIDRNDSLTFLEKYIIDKKENLNNVDNFSKIFLNKLLTKVKEIDRQDPVLSMEYKLRKMNEKINVLNNLNLTKLHYKNKLGTDLEACISEYFDSNYKKNKNGEYNLITLPSNQINAYFDSTKVNGIIYSTKPFIYYGNIINDYTLEFKDGKLVNYNAKDGSFWLARLINNDGFDKLSSSGLIEYDKMISNYLYCNSLIDANTLSYLRLKNNKNESVDLIIGSPDLQINGVNNNLGKVRIMKKGKFNKHIL